MLMMLKRFSKKKQKKKPEMEMFFLVISWPLKAWPDISLCLKKVYNIVVAHLKGKKSVILVYF